MMTSDPRQKCQYVDLNDPLTPGSFDGPVLKTGGVGEGGTMGVLQIAINIELVLT